MMITTTYTATRQLKKEKADKGPEKHLRKHLVKVDPKTVTVLAFSFLLMGLVLAVPTVPAPWRGLTPMDGYIMLGLYVIFLSQALLHGREEKELGEWNKKEN